MVLSTVHPNLDILACSILDHEFYNTVSNYNYNSLSLIVWLQHLFLIFNLLRYFNILKIFVCLKIPNYKLVGNTELDILALRL